MSGIAQVLLTLGYHVTGSDLRRSAVTTQLAKRGAKVFIGHKGTNIVGAHVVVISSAVHENNPEVKEARSLGIPVVPRAEMLSELMRLKYGIAVAGTHGKTTTTSLIATIMDTAKLDPTMVIGGKVNSFRTNARLGKGEFLVAEADESDRSFLKLSPTIAVITNIDPEHMENYRDFDHVKEAYASFANKVPFYGAVVACVDHPEVKRLLPRLERRIVTYGLDEGNWTASDIEQLHGVLRFTAAFNGKEEGELRLELPGRHNVLNALASIAVARELDIPFKTIQKGLARFKGIERRFHILKREPMIVTDYAHHPKEIEAVLSATEENWPERRVFCVMQPHRFTRLAALFDEFVSVLKRPQSLVIMPVYSAGEAPIEGANSNRLFEELKKNRNGASFTAFVKDKKEMFEVVKKNADEGDIILFLGAGDVWKMGKEFVKTMVGKE